MKKLTISLLGAALAVTIGLTFYFQPAVAREHKGSVKAVAHDTDLAESLSGPLSSATVTFGGWMTSPALDRFPDLDLVFIESGGDNLAASFSPELVDASIYVIDVSGGDKIPRKGGPGVTRSDLLVINKIDLAPMVGASLEVMDRDAKKMRGDGPFLFTQVINGVGVREVADQLLGAWRTAVRAAGTAT